MNCPRQDNEDTMLSQKAHVVTTYNRKGYNCCSYCGSLMPDEFMKLISEGSTLEPTDKNYKVYVDAPNKEQGEMIVIGSSNSTESPGDGWQKADSELVARYNKNNGMTVELDEWVLIQPDGPTAHLKFYFQHLDEGQCAAFVALYNAHKLSIGYPGHFYSLPFFCKPVTRT